MAFLEDIIKRAKEVNNRGFERFKIEENGKNAK